MCGGGGGGAGGGGWRGVCCLAIYSIAYEETQLNRVSDFRDFVFTLFPKAILFDFYFIPTQSIAAAECLTIKVCGRTLVVLLVGFLFSSFRSSLSPLLCFITLFHRISTLYVCRWFHMWCLFCQYLFLIDLFSVPFEDCALFSLTFLDCVHH